MKNAKEEQKRKQRSVTLNQRRTFRIFFERYQLKNEGVWFENAGYVNKSRQIKVKSKIYNKNEGVKFRQTKPS